MPYANQALSFESGLFPGEADKFLVAKITGVEKMSGLFEFELELLAKLPDPSSAEIDIDLAAMVRNSAKLKILANAATNPPTKDDWREVAGVLAAFEQQDQTSTGWARYRAVLVPKVWQATRTRRSRVFQNQSIDDLITAVLTESVLTADDLQSNLSRLPAGAATVDRAIYPARDAVVQYEESDWNFLARWLEHEGIYFYFQNDGQNGEQLVFADDTSGYVSPSVKLPYRPEGSGNSTTDAEEVRTFHASSTPQPTKLIVRDYNWRNTSLLSYEADVDANGTGESILCREHFLNEGQGQELAARRAEELSCRATVFHGTSNARSFRPGMTIQLVEHYRDDFDGDYLLTEVTHNAKQDLSIEGSNVKISSVSYDNSFAAIPSNLAWRPVRTSQAPKIDGLLTGLIVSNTAEDRYAVIDAQSRYLVEVRYDTSAAPIKRLVRMSQPSAGPSSGMHFPLNPGVEVVLAHINGDPDRPIILGAVPNPANESPSSDSNVSANTIQTRTGNLLQIDDDASASGFVTMDASRSRVSDHRRRGTADPLTSFVARVSALASGQGSAQPAPTSAAPSLDGESTQEGAAVPPPRQPRSDVPASGSGSPMAVGGETVPSLVTAWREFFDGDALDELGSLGPYRDGGGGMSVSTVDDKAAAKDSNLLGSDADASLTEANITKLLNYAIRNTGAADDFGSSTTDSGSPSLKGKIADVILRKAQNFEGSAAGSSVSVSLGDQIIYSLGDKFEYGDGSNSISIGTGGYTRNETLAEGTTEEITYGKQVSKTTNHGKQDSTETNHGEVWSNTTNHTKVNEQSYHYGPYEGFTMFVGGKASLDIQVSAQTVNAVNIGIFNSNTMNIAAMFDSAFYVAGKYELEVGSLLSSLQIAHTAEFVLSRSQGILNSDKVFLNDLQASLKTTSANLQSQKVALSNQYAALEKKEAALTSAKARVTGTDAAVSSTRAEIDGRIASINAQKAALQESFAALSVTQTSATNIATAAFHSKQ
jgi:type VI secretion system VgrG family protein